MGGGYNACVQQDYYDVRYKDSPIETATVLEVHKTSIPVPSILPGIVQQNLAIPHYSCRIKTEERVFDNVTWTSPYTNHTDGSGMYVVPTRGTKVLIVYSKGGQPYIIGWLSPIGEDGRYTGRRELVPDGSSVMRGNFGNKIVVYNGGVIKVQSSPVCRRTYIPGLDQIRDYCRNYVMTSAGGTRAWTESRDGQRFTAMRFEAFEKADDDRPEVQGPGESVRTQYGTHTEDELDPEPDTPPGKIFSFRVAKNTVVYIGKNGRIIIRNKQAETGVDPNKITIDNDGEINLSVVKAVSIDTETGAISFQAGSGGETKIDMDPDGDVSIESATKISIKAPQVAIEGDGTVDISAPIVKLDADTQVDISSPLVRLANGGLGVARLLDQVLCPDPETGPFIGIIIGSSNQVLAG